MPNFVYYQKDGGNEVWKPSPADDLAALADNMFVTILAISQVVPDGMPPDEKAKLKYKGPLYFDLDDGESPASTSKYAVELLGKLEELDLPMESVSIYASGGKGFHLTVHENAFLLKPTNAGFMLLPAIYKEMAYKLAVESMDFRVYTASKGRMLRQVNVPRPNGMYKVQLKLDELLEIANIASTDEESAEAMYKQICAAPRETWAVYPNRANGLAALFAEAKDKVESSSKKVKKAKKINLPKDLPSFDAMLAGEGIKEDAGFHPLAMQIAIVAHARGMSLEELLEKAEGLCETHASDGHRYNTPGKRRAELQRMWLYMEDNPCYAYAPNAVTSLLTHNGPDFSGIPTTAEEVQEAIANPDAEKDEADQYAHAGIVLLKKGAFVNAEEGLRQVCAMSFDNVNELVSAEDNRVTVIETDIYVGGEKVGRQTLELDTFNSVSNLNKFSMRYGQAFAGNDVQARGMYMRILEKARMNGQRKYVLNKEGLDLIRLPFSGDERLQKPFLTWADGGGVMSHPEIFDKASFAFVGFPDPKGSYRTDLSTATMLTEYVSDSENKEKLRKFIDALLSCQAPQHVGKWLGWMTACHWRMLFHHEYMKFPLLHVNGVAGAGKCLAKGTEVILSNGKFEKVENLKVGDRLLAPSGNAPETITSLACGREMMYRVTPVKGDSYVVNASHLLSLKRYAPGVVTLQNGETIGPFEMFTTITAEQYVANAERLSMCFCGWSNDEVAEFEDSTEVTDVSSLNSYRCASVIERKTVLYDLLSEQGTTYKQGVYVRWTSEEPAFDMQFIARSLGLSAWIECEKENGEFVWYVCVEGNFTKVFGENTFPHNPTATLSPITLEPLVVDDYYGFTLDGNRLFMLKDFTVTHNTESTTLFAKLHYNHAEPKMLTPTSTYFAVAQTVAGSASIPLVFDEFKPQEMSHQVYDKFKLMFRDAYNCRAVEKGGGTRENADYRSVHTTTLSAPIVFIAEAIEPETAVMERVVLLTLTKGSGYAMQRYRKNYEFCMENSQLLGVLGSYMAAEIVSECVPDMFRREFDELYNRNRYRLMLQDGDLENPNIPLKVKTLKAGTKERSVFNYSVANFGLLKFKALVTRIFGHEFDEKFHELESELFSTMEELQQQTTPEWLKVFNRFADLAVTGELTKNVDYKEIDYEGRPALALYLRSAYYKYRVRCHSMAEKPLYSGEQSFLHACNSLPCLIARGVAVDRMPVPGGVHVFDLESLREQGFREMVM